MSEKTKKKARLGVFNIALMAILILYTVLLVALLIWGCMTSLKTRGDFYNNKLGLPSGSIATWGWDNYSFVLKNFAVKKIDSLGRKISINIWGQLVNTVLYAVGGGLVTTACCCIVAYLTAKFPYFAFATNRLIRYVAWYVPYAVYVFRTVLLNFSRRVRGDFQGIFGSGDA